jgi:hypothetical protein
LGALAVSLINVKGAWPTKGGIRELRYLRHLPHLTPPVRVCSDGSASVYKYIVLVVSHEDYDNYARGSPKTAGTRMPGWPRSGSNHEPRPQG